MRERCRRGPRAESLERRVLLSTYYVSPSGSDAAAGGASAPWLTLQQAANTAVAGDTVHVLAGTYTTGMNFWGRAGGTAAAPIKFLADPGAVVTHSADSGLPNDSLAAINVENTGGYYVIQGFTIQSDGSIERAGIRVATSANVQVLDNKVDHAYIGIFASNCNDLLIQGNTCTRSTDQHGIYVGANTRRAVVRGNTLWGNNWDGLHMNASYAIGPNDGAVVEDNVIYGNELSGMDVEGVTHALFRNNVIYGNAKHGITFHSQDQTAAGDPTPPCAGNTVVNNTMAGNGMFALIFRPEDMADTAVFNNVLLSAAAANGSYGSIGVSASATGLTSDYNVVNDDFSTTLGDDSIPLAQWRSVTGQDVHSRIATPDQVFVNAAANDYRPMPWGASVDAGIASLAGQHAPYYDAAGKLRPRGSTWDAGAYEDDSLPDTTPPLITGVQSSNLTPKRATLSWITNELADTQVEYGLTAAYGQLSPLDPSVRDTHAVALAGLTPGSTYHFRVRSRDSFGNLGLSGDFTFTTPPAPTIPPVLDAIVADPWTLGVSVTWKTDVAADTLFEYGPTPAYGLSVTDVEFRTAHAVSVDALAPGMTYHYRIRNRDEYGNTTVSEDRTFTTPAVGARPPGAVSFWTFDGPEAPTVDDVTGNGNTGALLGGTDFVAGRDPSRGNALAFDGFDGHVHVSRNAALEPAAITLSAWVKLVLGADQATWVSIIKKDYADDTPPIFDSVSLSISPPGKPNVISFFTGHAGGDNDQLDSPAQLPTGQWVHVAGTYDPATGQKRLYVDGVLVGSHTLTRPIAYDPTSGGDLYIAKDPGPGEAYRGSIDDVGIWPRALSGNEIRTLAYGRPATFAAPTDLTTTVLAYTRVRLTWTDHTGGAAMYLVQRRVDGEQWTDVTTLGPGMTTFEDASASPSQLYQYRAFAYDPITASDPSAVAVASTKAGGVGLHAQYFDTSDLTGPVLARTDSTVDFAWGAGSPITGVAPGTFSVRWTGQVIAFETGKYKFFTTADDGVRLWVNGQLVIDHWSDRPELAGDANADGVVDFTDYQIVQRQYRTTNPQSDFNHDGIVNLADVQILLANMGKTLADTVPTHYGTVTLQAGVKYDIRLEYFQHAGIASASLGWITPSLVRQIIPSDALFPMLTMPPPDPVPIRPPPPPPRPVFCAQPVKKQPVVARKTVFIPPVVVVKKAVAKAAARR